MRSTKRGLAMFLAIMLMAPAQPAIAAQSRPLGIQREILKTTTTTAVNSSNRESNVVEGKIPGEENTTEKGDVIGSNIIENTTEESSTTVRDTTSGEDNTTDEENVAGKDTATGEGNTTEEGNITGKDTITGEGSTTDKENISDNDITQEYETTTEKENSSETGNRTQDGDKVGEGTLSEDRNGLDGESVEDENLLEKEPEVATSSNARPEKLKDAVIFNTGNHEFQVVSYEDFWENDQGDACFEEDGSYTINIPEENPLFPYEVQFTYDGKITNKWFMSPDDSVEIDGHTFYVSAYFDGSVITQMSLEIAGNTVIVYPEKKEFKNSSEEMLYSLLPLKKKNWSVDVTRFTPAELTMVSIDSIFAGNMQLENTDKVIWTHRGSDGYSVSSSGDMVDLSYGTCSGYCAWEMIVGENDQLQGDNLRCYITLNVAESKKWLLPTIYKQDNEGNRTNIKISKAEYVDYFDNNYYESGTRERSLNCWVKTSEVSYSDQVYVGFKINPSVFTDTQYSSVKVYEGQYQSAAEAMAGIEITDHIMNADMTGTDAGYLVSARTGKWITILTFDGGDNVTGCLPIFLQLYRRGTENWISTTLRAQSENGWDYVTYSSKETYIDGCYNRIGMLYSGLPANDIYKLNMSYYRDGQSDPSKVTAAYVGRYASIAEAEQAGTKNIKEELFGALSTSGYAADYSNGVYFTILVGEDGKEDQEIYYYNYKTEEGTTPLSSNTVVSFNGLKDQDGNDIKCRVIEEDEDSYAEYNYLTILVDQDVDLTSIAPVFYTRIGLHLYAVGSSSPEISGKSCHDFSNGPIQYTASAENGTDSKNYWLQIVKATDGEGWIYLNSLADEDAETRTEGGVIYSNREVFLDGFHDYIHDILIANMGKNEIASLSAELVSDEVELDEYWTLKGSHKLSGFDVTNGYDDLANMAKLRIKAKGGVKSGKDVTGTLTIKSGNQVLIVMTLTGTVGDPSIITEDIPQAVKYVPYGTMIQNSNKYSWNQTQYILKGGRLPAGMELKPNGELYGVPTEPGEFTFTVRLESSENSFKASERTYTLIVNENTDENVDAATDKGYELTERIQYVDLNSTESKLIVSQGTYGEFVDIYLDGMKLQKDVDYTSESGSTRITIRSQTLKDNGVTGTHTLGIEFRTKDTNTLKRAAQNYKVTRSRQDSGSSSNSGGGSNVSVLIRDPKKGYMNAQSGIVTGEGANYSSWHQDEKGWKLVYPDGTTASGYMAEQPDQSVVEQVIWEKINGSWYAFGVDGYIKSGWVYDYLLKNWYCVSVDSGMRTGWYSDSQDQCIYYLDSVSGQAVTGWKQINGKWYYFNMISAGPTWIFDENTGSWSYNVKSRNKPFGAMYHNEKTPDGFWVDKNGEWDGKEG